MERHFRIAGIVLTLTSLMLAGFLAGCSSFFEQDPTPNPTVTSLTINPSPTASTVINYDKTRWLKGIPCKPPCWENIIPGKTDITEATSLLKANPAVRSVIQDARYLTVTWYTPGLPATLYFDSTKIITKIELGLDFYEFKDIQAVLGEPDLVVAERNLRHGTPTAGNTFGYYSIYNATLIWQKAGVLLHTRNDDTEEPQFNPQILLRGPVLFANDGKTLQEILHNRKDYTVQWQAGGTFRTYCRYENSQLGKIAPCFNQ